MNTFEVESTGLVLRGWGRKSPARFPGFWQLSQWKYCLLKWGILKKEQICEREDEEFGVSPVN